MPKGAGREAPVEAPEDVAALYAWADLKGLKYHDFSASRRAVRARLRELAITNQREAKIASRPGPERALGAAPGVPLVPSAGEAGQGMGAHGLERVAPVGAAGRESMLPQRFPRRRQARDLAPLLRESTEARQRREDLEQKPAGAKDVLPQAEECQQKPGGGIAEPAAPRNGQRAPESAAEDQRTAPESDGRWRDAADSAAERGEAGYAAGSGGSIPAWIHDHGKSGYGNSGQGKSAEGRTVDGRTGEGSARGTATRADAVTGAAEAGSPVMNTLQHSRERVASRWYALRGVFDPAAPAMEPTQAHAHEGGTPVVGVFSLAGGVGKTSLTAALGRALSSVGERVLLADITSHGLLPFYFGSKELRPGVVREFLPPAGNLDAPISLVSYEAGLQEGGSTGDAVWAELARRREGFDRIVVDLSPAAPGMAKGLLGMSATMLVPVAPDMNSVIGLSAVERFFAGLGEGAGTVIQPRYVLTQFDSSLPLHLDVREVMRQQLGDRLLPFVIRRSPAVSEALAEGMTVIDYAPGAGVAEDYRDLAHWARTFAAPTTVGKSARWSER